MCIYEYIMRNIRTSSKVPTITSQLGGASEHHPKSQQGVKDFSFQTLVKKIGEKQFKMPEYSSRDAIMQILPSAEETEIVLFKLIYQAQMALTDVPEETSNADENILKMNMTEPSPADNNLHVCQADTNSQLCQGDSISLLHQENNDSEICQGDSSSEICQGENSSQLHQENSNSEICQGDSNSEICQGENSSQLCQGDNSSEICQGDNSLEICQGDNSSEICQGDTNSQICQGDNSSQLSQGDNSSQLCQGDTNSQICQENDCSQFCQGDNSSQLCQGDTNSQICQENDSSQFCQGDSSSQLCQGDTNSQLCQIDHSSQVFQEDSSLQLCQGDNSSQLCETDNKSELCQANENAKLCETDDKSKLCQADDNSQLCEREDKSEICQADFNSQICETDDKSKLCQANDNSQLCETDDKYELSQANYNSQLCETDDKSELCQADNNSQLCETDDKSKLCQADDNSQLCEIDDKSELRQENDNSQLCETDDKSEVCQADDNSQLCETDDKSELCQADDNSQLYETNYKSELCQPDDNLQIRETDDNSQICQANNNSKLCQTDDMLELCRPDDISQNDKAVQTEKTKTEEKELKLQKEVTSLQDQLSQSKMLVRKLQSTLIIQQVQNNNIISGLKQQLQKSQDEIKKQRLKYDRQLGEVISHLLFLEGQLKKEKKNISQVLKERDEIIEQQKAQITTLTNTNDRLLQAVREIYGRKGKNGVVHEGTHTEDNRPSSPSLKDKEKLKSSDKSRLSSLKDKLWKHRSSLDLTEADINVKSGLISSRQYSSQENLLSIGKRNKAARAIRDKKCRSIAGYPDGTLADLILEVPDESENRSGHELHETFGPDYEHWKLKYLCENGHSDNSSQSGSTGAININGRSSNGLDDMSSASLSGSMPILSERDTNANLSPPKDRPHSVSSFEHLQVHDDHSPPDKSPATSPTNGSFSEKNPFKNLKTILKRKGSKMKSNKKRTVSLSHPPNQHQDSMKKHFEKFDMS